MSRQGYLLPTTRIAGHLYGATLHSPVGGPPTTTSNMSTRESCPTADGTGNGNLGEGTLPELMHEVDEALGVFGCARPGSSQGGASAASKAAANLRKRIRHAQSGEGRRSSQSVHAQT